MAKGRIHTRTGDRGETGLFDGSRVSKADARIECLGTIDEVASTIGWLRTKLPAVHPWQDGLHRVQEDLMTCMALVATPGDSAKASSLKVPEGAALRIEAWLDDIETRLGTPTNAFILPGGNEVSAICHMIRTQVRRAERRLVVLHAKDPVHPEVLALVNRLSDLFFKLAREEMEVAKIPEERWRSFR